MGHYFITVGNSFLKSIAACLLAAFCLAACGESPAIPASSVTTQAQTELPASFTPTYFIASPTDNAINIVGVQFISPGPQSSVASPIKLRALVQPGDRNQVHVALLDSNGRLLARQVLKMDGKGELNIDIAFEISQPRRNARLVLITKDKYGRVQALDSVDLVLLSQGGHPDLTSATEGNAIEITSPTYGELIAGNQVTVSGLVYTVPDQPLTIKLITRENKVLAFDTVYPKDGKFEITLNYSVKEMTWVQVAVIENGGVVPGEAHFVAVEVQLAP